MIRTLARTFLLFCTATIATLHAQTPDCSFTLSLSANNVTTVYDNRSQSRQCVSWRVTQFTTGYTSVTVELQTSPDGTTYTAVTSQLCATANNFQNCQTDGVNPIVGKNAFAASRSYAPFMRLKVTAVTGSGSGTAVVLGYRGTSASASSGGGGGSPGGSDNQLQYRVSATTFGGVGSFTLPNVTATGAPVASLPLSGWTEINSGILNDFSQGITQVSVLDNAGVNFRGITRNITVPYTIYGLVLCQPTTAFVSSQTCGFAISDGTKYETFEYLYQNAQPILLQTRTTANVTTGGSIVTGPTSGVSTELLAVRLVNNSTNRIFSYWRNGAWVVFQTEASGTFLTETKAGLLGLSLTGNNNNAVDMSLLYWSVQ